jgi:tRNA threonylcarbamoyladenosine biosynthesis protein TsaE
LKRVQNKKENSFVSSSVEETEAVARNLAPHLPQGTVICLFGDLGAGKTTFIRGLAAGRGCPPEIVSSPTFTYLNIYEGNPDLYHFDLYRLKGVEEFLGMGFESYLGDEAIACIEWSERITPLLEELEVLSLNVEHKGQGKRKLTFTGAWPDALSI